MSNIAQLRAWAEEQNTLHTHQLKHALLYSTKTATVSSGPLLFETLEKNHPLICSFFKVANGSEARERKQLEALLKEFNEIFMKKNLRFWSPPAQTSELVFFNLSLETLTQSKWPSWFCLLICQGLMKVCHHLISNSPSQEESLVRFNKWLTSHLKPQECVPSLISWQRSYAAYLFYWAQVFEGADAENGLAMLPCFNLPDGEILYYGEAVLGMVHEATLALIDDEERLNDKVEISNSWTLG